MNNFFLTKERSINTFLRAKSFNFKQISSIFKQKWIFDRQKSILLFVKLSVVSFHVVSKGLICTFGEFYLLVSLIDVVFV